MEPKEWAEWFRNKFPNESIDDLVKALRSAAKYNFWHQSHYAEFVIKHLKNMK